jgi:hypothetical protein
VAADPIDPIPSGPALPGAALRELRVRVSTAGFACATLMRMQFALAGSRR